MSTVAAIEPRTKIVGPNHTDVQISANPWNQPRIVTGGATGGLFVRDAVNADGWGLINAVAVGSVLVSAGVGAVPSWSTTLPPLTFSSYIAVGSTPVAATGAIRLANANEIETRNAGNTADIWTIGVYSDNKVYVGDGLDDAGMVLRTTAGVTIPGSTGAFVALGTNPATQGAIRLANNQGIYYRNAANTADVLALNVDGANGLTLGSSSASQAGFVAGGSSASLGVSGSATPVFTWSVVSSGDFVPANDNAYDIGRTAKRAKNGYFAGSLFATDVNAATIQSPSGSNLTLAGIGATAGLLFYSGGANRWGLNQVGTLYPVADATNQIGTTSNRVLAVYLSGELRWGVTAADPMLRRSGAELQAVLGDASDYATVRAKTYLASGSVQITTSTGFVSIGSPAASAGAIRLAYDGYIYARNSANTGDVLVLGHYQDTVFVTSSGAPNLVPGSGDAAGSLGKAANRWIAAHLYYLALADPYGAAGSAPSAVAGQARIYVDGTDGDLKVIFGDGVVKTIVVDS